MIKINKRRNSTNLDEIGFLYGLSREVDEDINDFRHRLYLCIKGTVKSEKESFQKSLGYITKLNNKNVFKISITDNSEVQIKVTSSKLYIYRNESLYYSNTLKNIKFLKNLKELLETVDFSFLQIEILQEEGWEYLKAENLIPCDSNRHYEKHRVLTQGEELPEALVTEVRDISGEFINKVNGEELVSKEDNYAIENDNVLHKYKLRSESIAFNYSDFPFVLSYSPIKACGVNDADFDYILKSANIDYEVYGLGPSQEKETERFISQEGSVIINKILEKQNTYWGE